MEHNQITILLAEDDLLIRKSTARYLADKGYDIAQAANGQEAWQLFTEIKPNLLLTDLRMPKLDGLELVQRVVKQSPETPVIIFSGMGTMIDVIDALRLGAWDYITKPVADLDILGHSINKALERAELLRLAKERHTHLEQEVTYRTEKIRQQNRTLQEEIKQRQSQEALVLKAKQEKEILYAQLLQAQKLEAVGQLASGIAHEINTPTQFVGSNVEFFAEAMADISTFMARLNIIIAQAPANIQDEVKTALDDADWDYLEEELPRAVEQSREGVRRVSSIVRAMKEFSHPGTRGKINHDLNKIIETTVTVAKNEWKYVAEMELDLAIDLPEVPCLSDEIGQVLLNLLVNGAHAIADKLGENPEGEKGQIHISTACTAEGVEIRVTDSGAGIPTDIQQKIFEPFFTTKEVGAGTGQGLAIAHDVIHGKHGGTLTFESKKEEGTVFIITLPLRSTEVKP